MNRTPHDPCDCSEVWLEHREALVRAAFNIKPDCILDWHDRDPLRLNGWKRRRDENTVEVYDLANDHWRLVRMDRPSDWAIHLVPPVGGEAPR